MNRIEFGDCRETMRRWAADGVKVQTCVTSPPYYGLRDYGHECQIGLEETPDEYIKAMVEVFRCVWDVLAEDGTLWINIGDSYAGSGKGKWKDGEHDPKKAKTDGMKLATQKPSDIGCKPKDLIGIPWMLAFALRADGWYLRSDIIWEKPNAMPESVKDRCAKSHEYIFMLSKNASYFFDHEAIQERAIYVGDNRGARGDARRGSSMNSMSGATGESRNKRSVWSVNTKPYSGSHFAVFPEELITPCILAGSRAGDIVLDPFMGSGTTAAVAMKHGRRYLGCELNQDYAKLQQARVDESTDLFSSVLTGSEIEPKAAAANQRKQRVI
jgi:DNA modification methylase